MICFKLVFYCLIHSIYTQAIEKTAYKKNCETFCHTATLLINNLKYLTAISICFTKGKNEGRV